MATAATLAPERLLTIEEYLALPPRVEPTELVRGRVIVLNPPYPWHGYVCGRSAFLLNQFVTEHKCGSVLTNDSGVVTEKDPDSLRGADVAYYSFERVPLEVLKQQGYLSIPPDLILEVKSPSDRWKHILAKVAEYLNAGVNVVCVLDPERSTITVYQPDLPEETLSAEQILTLPTVLPKFAVQVGRFFELAIRKLSRLRRFAVQRARGCYPRLPGMESYLSLQARCWRRLCFRIHQEQTWGSRMIIDQSHQLQLP